MLRIRTGQELWELVADIKKKKEKSLEWMGH